MKLLILLDYRSQFYSSTKWRGASLDVVRLRTRFEQCGYDVSVKHFSEVDFKKSHRGIFVLYQSSEDPSLSYKEYVEDILLGLQMQGAILVPSFEKFRAHHNKVFMEVLRQVNGIEEIQTISSQCFGSYEEYQNSFDPQSYPRVFKPSSGSKSRGVLIARNRDEANICARKLSATPSFYNLGVTIRNWFDRKGFSPMSVNRRKFIVQSYVPNLSGDYKIVIYGKKYFVLFRENRENDFRASGSGRLSFPTEVPHQVLDFAQLAFCAFDAPYSSIDIGFDGQTCYLFEFQFVMFGQHAVEHSKWHFVKNGSGWKRVEEIVSAENELVSAVHEYVQNKEGVM